LNCFQTTPSKCRFFNSLQCRVRFKCNRCKWCIKGKAGFAQNFNWCRHSCFPSSTFSLDRLINSHFRRFQWFPIRMRNDTISSDSLCISSNYHQRMNTS
jgi:hypothetical protein